MVRRFLRVIVGFLFRLLARLDVTGLENIPQRGGVILAPNHLGRLDAALIFIMLERQDVSGLVADTYQKSPFFRWLVNVVGGIWINRQAADVQALRQARWFLQQGGMLGIAPEGTRSRSGALQQAKTGVAYLADKAGVPVVPVAIAGTEKAFDELFHFRRPHLILRIGEPFTLPPLERGDRDQGLRRNTDEIMCRIAAMLPPSYRGFYTDHPRLQELLASCQ